MTTEHTIQLTHGAEADLLWFDAHDRRIILDGLDIHLKHQPASQTHRLKRLRPNPVAEWELRLREFRVLFDVDESLHVATVQVIGKKKGNRLVVQGQEYQKHESDRS